MISNKQSNLLWKNWLRLHSYFRKSLRLRLESTPTLRLLCTSAPYSHPVSHFCVIWGRCSENTSRFHSVWQQQASFQKLGPLKILIGSCTDLHVDSGSCSGPNLKYWLLFLLQPKMHTPAGVHSSTPAPWSSLVTTLQRWVDCVEFALHPQHEMSRFWNTNNKGLQLLQKQVKKATQKSIRGFT